MRAAAVAPVVGAPPAVAALVDAALRALEHQVQALVRAPVARPPLRVPARRLAQVDVQVSALVCLGPVQLRRPGHRLRVRARQVVAAQVRAAARAVGAVPAVPVGVVLAAPRTADRRSPPWR